MVGHSGSSRSTSGSHPRSTAGHVPVGWYGDQARSDSLNWHDDCPLCPLPLWPPIAPLSIPRGLSERRDQQEAETASDAEGLAALDMRRGLVRHCLFGEIIRRHVPEGGKPTSGRICAHISQHHSWNWSCVELTVYCLETVYNCVGLNDGPEAGAVGVVGSGCGALNTRRGFFRTTCQRPGWPLRVCLVLPPDLCISSPLAVP
jgi:hypothetical protein